MLYLLMEKENLVKLGKGIDEYLFNTYNPAKSIKFKIKTVQ